MQLARAAGPACHQKRFDIEPMPHYKLHPRSLHKRNKQEEAAVADMSIPSKPIPIPRRTDDPHSSPNDIMIMTPREATEVYDAATWRMFELITSARLRAARDHHYKVLYVPTHHHHDDDDLHNAALAAGGGKTSSSQLQQLEVTHHRDRALSLPEPPTSASPTSSMMDEVFPMDSL